MSPDRVKVPLEATDKRGVIRELARLLVDRSGGQYEDIVHAVEEREAVLSTGIGHGVAIPHGRSSTIEQLAVVGGVTAKPMPFDAVDGDPVNVFFLIVGPESSAGQHVKVLSRIARIIRLESVRARLAQAGSPADFYKALLDAEER